VVDSNMQEKVSLVVSGRRVLEVRGAEGSLCRPIVRIPCIWVRGEATLILKGLTLEFQPSKTGRRKPLLYAEGCCSVVLEDCCLRGSGICIRGECHLQLTRTSIEGSMGMPGIDGKDFSSLTLKECIIRGSDSDGLRIGSEIGTCDMEDCRVSDNEVHGCVAAGNLSGRWHVARCTFSNNGQCGFWVDTDACIKWGSNSFSDNLQETGGRGTLIGYMRGRIFSEGDSCKVWTDEHAAWLPGVIRELKQGRSILVAVQDPNKRLMKLNKKSKDTTQDNVLHLVIDEDLVQQPKSGWYEPPFWSTVAKKAKENADRERQRKEEKNAEKREKRKAEAAPFGNMKRKLERRSAPSLLAPSKRAATETPTG